LPRSPATDRHSFAWARGDLVFAYRQYERLMKHWRRVLPRARIPRQRLGSRQAFPARSECGFGRTRDFLFVVEKALLVEKSSLLSAKKPPVQRLKIPC
jgi:hypothetical protein